MIFHSIVGFLAWLVATLVFRWFGHHFFYPDDVVLAVLFIVTAPVMWFLMLIYLRGIRVYPENRALAAIAFVLPGILLDALATVFFTSVFPNLDMSLDGRFAALMLWAYGFLLLGGYTADRRFRRALDLPLERIAAP